jgi:hypothetical protein
MGNNFPAKSIRPSRYVPTQPRSGNVNDGTLFRMENALIRGRDPLTYLECYGGSLSLSETIATSDLTGTLAVTSGSAAVVGTGTAFTTELNPGQFVIAVNTSTHESYWLAVKEITSDTSFTAWRATTSSKSGMTGKRTPVIFSVDQQRGTQIWGNTIRNDKGTLLSTGQGTFRLNGTALSSSLSVTRAPQISLYNSGAGTYTNFTLGMATSAAPTLAAVASISISSATNASPVVFTTATSHYLTTGQRITISGATGTWTSVNGSFLVTVLSTTTFSIPIDSSGFGALTGTLIVTGSLGMQAGTYSIVLTPERTQTLGYNNPSVKAIVTIVANSFVTIPFPAMDTTNGQNAWGVWVTRYADTLGADLNYLEGPWYRLDQYTGSTSGFSLNIEWLDAMVERQPLVTFDNDAPPASNFVAILNNGPVWISCQGVNNSSPGPFIFPSKPGNIEAAPAVIAFSSSPPETIVGARSASGRVYLLTTNHLEIALGTPQTDVPVVIRPFWTVGFTRPEQLVFINDTLYGHSVQGPARSSSDGVPGSQEFDFAVDVSEITDAWIAGHVLVEYDPISNAVCFFHVANAVNASGYWTTRILAYGLRQEAWIGDITLSSTTQDMIVTSCAMVQNRLQFLCGGRLSNDTVSIGTYQFDTLAGSAVNWYAAGPFEDYDSELVSHVVKRVRITGKTTGGSIGVFGAQPTESIPVTSLEAGNSSSLTGAVSITNASTVTQSQQFPVNCPNLAQSTIRVQGTFNGSDSVKDQLHEIVIQSASEGVRI